MSAPTFDTGETTARVVWSRVIDRARQELPEGSVAMWFQGVRPTTLEGGVLRLLTPSDLVRDRLARQYLSLIRAAASDAMGGDAVDVELATDPEGARAARRAAGHGEEAGEEPGEEEASEPASPAPRPGSREAVAVSAAGIPSGYSFDTFVPGPSNRFAHAAAMAVAEAPPSRAYNPLFISGGVGLGPTHLLYAIAVHMTRLAPVLRVKYVTSETFMAEFIQAVRERQGYQFAARYRDIDVLLVDDIQFLARREETQTEFFHTFNALQAKERQIVIASDRPPHELSGMEERLRSRFRLGLCVDVQPPDLETRIAILQVKAARDGIEVPEDVLELIASKFDQNIRELEGALLRVAAFASFSGKPVDTELAGRALVDLLPQSESDVPPEVIMDETAAHFSLSRADLVGKSRSRPLTTARHIAMYLVREQNGLSLVRIGELFGGRDHTTVIHAISKVEQLMRARGSTYLQVQELTRRIRARSRGG
ncbi:MAG: chromosomal replication initiator protein DnaA [Actinobacteria bacterium]|nr:chromosomal replication initiator protein DnaA [Actinomycetota bacterium]